MSVVSLILISNEAMLVTEGPVVKTAGFSFLFFEISFLTNDAQVGALLALMNDKTDELIELFGDAGSEGAVSAALAIVNVVPVANKNAVLVLIVTIHSSPIRPGRAVTVPLGFVALENDALGCMDSVNRPIFFF